MSNQLVEIPCFVVMSPLPPPSSFFCRWKKLELGVTSLSQRKVRALDFIFLRI